MQFKVTGNSTDVNLDRYQLLDILIAEVLESNKEDHAALATSLTSYLQSKNTLSQFNLDQLVVTAFTLVALALVALVLVALVSETFLSNFLVTAFTLVAEDFLFLELTLSFPLIAFFSTNFLFGLLSFVLDLVSLVVCFLFAII